MSKEKRSRVMSRIRSGNTKIEVKLRRALRERNLLGYRIHTNIAGKPDICFTKKKVAIFVDGDFWHGYNWRVLGKVPPPGYWKTKIQKTIRRDRSNKKILEKGGWTVLRFWEHEVEEDLGACVRTIEKVLRQSE